MTPAQDLRLAGGVDVCVCTYKRRTIEATLRSLAAQTLDPRRIRVIVADNNADSDLRSWLETLAQSLGLNLLYVHAPEHNISIARNACLAAASADLVAFIDDDEWACPDWLEALTRTLETTGADVVLGPVRGVYGEDAPSWFVKNRLHDVAPPFLASGAVKSGYTSNVLLRRSVIGELVFNVARGRTGGEDTEFFHRLQAQGRTLAYCPEAFVSEHVPQNRLAVTWFVQRAYRSGQTLGTLMAEAPQTRLRDIVSEIMKFSYCLGEIALNAFSKARRLNAVKRAALHAGILAGLFGVKEILNY